MAKNTKISKIKEVEDTTGDITSVIGGTNISVSGGTSGDATVNLDSNIVVNSIRTSEIGSLTDINLNLDTDGDGTNSVKIKNHAGTAVCTIDESGDVTITGKLTSTYASKSSGGNILVEDSGEIKSKTAAELKSDLTLNNVENKTSATIRGEIVDGNIPNLATSKITSGTFDAARIPTLDSDKVKQIVVTHHHFFMNNSSTSVDFFFPYNNLNEASSTSQYFTRTIAPYDGKIIKVLIRPSAAIGTACKLQFHKITDTTLDFGTAVEEVTSINLNTAETSVSTAFSSATFSAGNVVNVSLIKSESATANIQAVIVWEYTT